MKVLMISGDKNILSPGSGAHARLELQRGQVDQLDVFVWPQVHSKFALWRAARKNRYDVITAQDPFWRGLFAWKLARMAGAKLNVQVHADLTGQSLIKRTLAQIVLWHADSIRVVSEKLKAQVEKIGVRAPIHLLPIFIDIEPFKALTPEPHEQKTILWVGRFESEKDPLSALDVVKEVRAQGVNATLVMLGAGSLEPALRKSAGALPVEFPGWQDPKPYLKKADVVLCTSRYESWGASIVEALAAGVPVVASDVGVAKEAGAIVVPRTELAQAVVRVLHSGERGELKIPTYTASEWATKWKESLV